jgi:hypothetical protein
VETATTATLEVLNKMFLENTGRSFLDSGNAYGRHFERQQSISDAQREQEKTSVDEYGDITIPLFQAISGVVEYDPELNEQWKKFDAEHPDDSWHDTVGMFLDELGVSRTGELYSDSFRYGFNSYNSENYLSQDFQAEIFAYGFEVYALLQIHGGADIRGGYTAPVVFKCDWESLVTLGQTAFLNCAECDFDLVMNVFDDVVESTDDLPENWELKNGCPRCKSKF